MKTFLGKNIFVLNSSLVI